MAYIRGRWAGDPICIRDLPSSVPRNSAIVKMKGSIVSAALAFVPAALAQWTWEEAEGKSINFTSVPGYFLQDDAATNPTGFDYVSDSHHGILQERTPLTQPRPPSTSG